MFLEKYKRLDNLCRDMFDSDRGVSSYIEEMERLGRGYWNDDGWKDDYHTLKEYRHIRNKIAHENYADEESLCSLSDEKWLENFYDRILNGDDPLAKERRRREALNKQLKQSFTRKSDLLMEEYDNKKKNYNSNGNSYKPRKNENASLYFVIFIVSIMGLITYLSVFR